MSDIRQMQCPLCGAPLAVPTGATRATCDYCKNTMAVEVDQGEMILHANQQMVGAVREGNEQTRAVLERMELTQRRAQLIQDIGGARNQRQALDAELRTLQRSPKTLTIKLQIGQVKVRQRETSAQVSQLEGEIGAIDRALNPHAGTDAAGSGGVGPATKASGRRRGCAVLLPAIVAFFVFGVVLVIVGYLWPLTILGAIALVVLAWVRPTMVERVASLRLLRWVPASLRATPKRFALAAAAVLIPMAILGGVGTYSPKAAPGSVALSASPTTIRTPLAAQTPVSLPTPSVVAATLLPPATTILTVTPTPIPTPTSAPTSTPLPTGPTAHDQEVASDLLLFLHRNFRDAPWYQFIQGGAVQEERSGIVTTLGTSSSDRPVANTICNATLSYVTFRPSVDIKFGSESGIKEVTVFTQDRRAITTCTRR